MPSHQTRNDAAQRALELRARVASRVGVGDRELQVAAEQPLAGRGRRATAISSASTGIHVAVISTGANSGWPSQYRERRRERRPAPRSSDRSSASTQSPDRVVEETRGEPVPRPRLARAAGLRALELGHPQLEDPARVLLRLVGAEEHALLAPPVEDREVGLRHAAPAPCGAGVGASPGDAVDDAVDERQHEQRHRQPDEHLLRDEHRVGGRDEDDRGGDEGAEQRAQAERDDRRAAERRDALGQAGVVQSARSWRARRASRPVLQRPRRRLGGFCGRRCPRRRSARRLRPPRC